MDRIIKITLCLFIIILAVFSGYFLYNGYVTNAYRTSLTSTYTYTCTFSTDTPLYNVTLFIPIPTGRAGSSPMVDQFSRQGFLQIPDSWTTTLFGSGKTTQLKITTPAIVPPAGTSPSNPYEVTLMAEYPVKGPIGTADPVADSAMFRPVQNLNQISCTAGALPGATCYSYSTSLYADYTTQPGATVRFASSIDGKNSWKIFEPAENEYRSSASLILHGENHGWTPVQATLESGSGTYNVPAISS